MNRAVAFGLILLGAAAPAGGAVSEQPGKMIGWDEKTRPGPAVYRIGDLTLTLSGQGKDIRAPVLVVRASDGRQARVVGEAGLSIARAQIGVGKVDASGPPDQVLFTSYTGGAHCCLVVRLVQLTAAGPKVLKLPQRNGGEVADFPRDLDGDGRPEFRFVDERFLYAFASYAGSYAAPQFIAIDKGAQKDVSAAPGFRKAFEDYAAKTRPDCETKHYNGACAAYVAAMARAGKADQAWPVMLASYDKADGWTPPTACRIARDRNGICPDTQQVAFKTYPESLRWFLGDAGYLTRTYVEPAGAKGPSFGCTGNLSATLKLVCTSPALAKADRDLAVAYERAMALSNDPAATRAAQRAFLQARDQAPVQAQGLLKLYRDRTAILARQAG